MQAQDHGTEISVAALKAAPPVVASGMVLAGHPINDWLVVATLVYVILQAIFLIRKELFSRRTRDGNPNP